MVIAEVKGKGGIIGYKVEPWLKTTRDDMFILNMTDVLTMSESSDIEMISIYQNYVRQSKKEGRNAKLTKEMGYLSNVRDAKELLEKIFKSN